LVTPLFLIEVESTSQDASSVEKYLAWYKSKVTDAANLSENDHGTQLWRKLLRITNPTCLQKHNNG
jgi:hypothetical protein